MPGQAAPAELGQAGNLLYGTVQSWSSQAQKDEEAWLCRLFPEAFACGCLLLFAAPLVKTVHLASDPLVAHWVGNMPKVGVALSLSMVFAGYAMHKAWGRPSKCAVMLSLLGSSVVLGALANYLSITSIELGDKFIASDCASFPAKYVLEREWKEARDFRSACRSSMGSATYVVQDCPGYDLASPRHASWEFLKTLESTYACAGWCSEQTPLWTLGKTEDSCSFVSGFVMTAKIHPNANQVLVYCAVVLAMAVLALYGLGPWLRQRGWDW